MHWSGGNKHKLFSHEESNTLLAMSAKSQQFNPACLQFFILQDRNSFLAMAIGMVNICVFLSVCPSAMLCTVAKQVILCQKVSEKVNKQFLCRNMILHISTFYTDPEHPKTIPRNDCMKVMHQNKKVQKQTLFKTVNK